MQQKEKLRIVCGIHPVEAMLKSKLKVDKLFLLSSAQKSKFQNILDLAFQRQIPIEWVGERKELDLLTNELNHQGAAAWMKTEAQYHALDEVKDAQLLLMLDHITDDRNFGAILRSVDLLGVDGVIIPQDRASQINEAVIRSSSGAAFFTKIIRVVNLSQALEQLKDYGFWSYAAVGLGGESVRQVQFARQSVLILGNEGEGISDRLLKNSDFKITIPSSGNIDSFNVSVAAAILLYEASAQLKS